MRHSNNTKHSAPRILASFAMSALLTLGSFPLPALTGFAESMEPQDSIPDPPTEGLVAQSDVSADDVASGIAAGLMAALADAPEADRLAAAFHAVADVATVVDDDGTTTLNDQTVAALHGGVTTSAGAANAFVLLAGNMGLTAELGYVNDWPTPRVFVAENWLSVDVASAAIARADQGNTTAEVPWDESQVVAPEVDVDEFEEEAAPEEFAEEEAAVEEEVSANAPVPIEEEAELAAAAEQEAAQKKDATTSSTEPAASTASDDDEPAATTQATIRTSISDNVTYNGWGLDNYLWDGARLSALHIHDGSLERVEYVNNKLVVETLSSSLTSVASKPTIDAKNYQPSNLVAGNFRWGGFYSGAGYNYVVTGQENEGNNDSLVVYRISKFKKDWTFVKALELTKANVSGSAGTEIPFSQGTCVFEELGNELHIRTAQENYEGVQHNVHIVVNTSNMTLADSMMYELNQWQTTFGYVSHSFSQRLANLNGNLYALDLGDSYPRGVTIKSIGYVDPDPEHITSCSKIFNITGDAGDNYTGVVFGGFEGSSDTGKLVSVFGSIDQKKSEGDYFGVRNIYIATTNGGSNVTSSKVVKLTNYANNGDVGAALIKLVKLDDAGSRFMVIWSEMDCAEPWWNETSQNGKVCYTIIDGNGTRVSDIYTQDGYLSDCEPIMYNSVVTWYAQNYLGDNKPVYYSIDPSRCQLSEVTRVGSIADATIATIESQSYTGHAVEPPVAVTYAGMELHENVDYTLNYTNNVNEGTATVTVKGANGYTGSKKVSFLIKKKTTISASNKTVPYASTGTVGATVNSGASLSYKSSDANTVKVDAKGNLTPVKQGSATITITAPENTTYSGATKKIDVNVVKGTPTITASNKTVGMGKTVSINATATSGAGKISYTSKNTKVAKVDANGKVTPVAAGSATITVSSASATNYNSTSKNITVSVTRGTPTITASNMTVNMGTPKSLGATINAGAAALTYKSSSTAIVKVDSTGKLTPVKVGKATITISNPANASWSSVTKKVTVTVAKGTPKITAANANVTMGKTFSLGATTTSGAPALSYKSSSTAVAKVSAKGVVTPVKVGTAKITISSASNGSWNAATKTITVTVKKAQPMVVSGAAKTAAAATVKKQAVTVAPLTVTKAQGSVTYAKSSGAACLSVNKTTGKVTVAKGTANGTYSIAIKVTAAGNGTYFSGTKTVTVKVTVK